MSEEKLVPNRSVVFVQPVEKIDDGVLKGIINKVGENGQYYNSRGETVIYNVNDVLMKFSDPKDGRQLHAIFYYKIIGKLQKPECKKEPVEKSKKNTCDMPFEGLPSY